MYALKIRVCVISIQGDYRQDGGQQLICVSVEGEGIRTLQIV